jgi:hypothetical protein
LLQRLYIRQPGTSLSLHCRQRKVYFRSKSVIFFSIPIFIPASWSPKNQLHHAGIAPAHILKTEGARIYFRIKINRELTRARHPAPPFPQPLHEFFLKPGFYCISRLNSMPSTIPNTVVVDEYENWSGWNSKMRRI